MIDAGTGPWACSPTGHFKVVFFPFEFLVSILDTKEGFSPPLAVKEFIILNRQVAQCSTGFKLHWGFLSAIFVSTMMWSIVLLSSLRWMVTTLNYDTIYITRRSYLLRPWFKLHRNKPYSRPNPVTTPDLKLSHALKTGHNIFSIKILKWILFTQHSVQC